MPALTGLTAITDAFGILNVYLPGESPSDNDAQFGLRTLNKLLSTWRQRSLLVNATSRERFDLTANKGSLTNPYTIGSGGNLNTDRPANQSSLVGANLILTTVSPESRVPLGVLDDQQWQALATPDLTGTQPAVIYYNPTFAGGLGSLYLWPVPDNATNDIELFLASSLDAFANLTTSYQLADGVDTALVYNLAKLLAGPFGRQMSEDDKRFAENSLAVVKRANLKMSTVANDFGRGGRYDITSGTVWFR